MHYTFTQLPKSEAEIEVTIPFEEFEPYVKRAATTISEEIKIEGFRPGKAPYAVVRDKVGEHHIYERAAEIAVRRTYPEVLKKILEEQQLLGNNPPLGSPEITVTKLASGNELQYKAKIAFLPVVTLPEYRRIAAEVAHQKQELHVNEEEVDRAIDWIRESRVTHSPVDRPAILGDAVEIDLEIRHRGVKIEGGESYNHPIIVGKGKFLPGVEEQLVGMKQGEEKLFSVEVPETWRQNTLAGKALDIKAVMKKIEERISPELTDAFVKELGAFTSVAALKENIREGILQEKREKEKQRIRILIIESIANHAQAEIPAVLVSAELEKMLAELKSGIGEMGMKWEDYLVHIKKTVENLKTEWRQEAEKRVLIALVLREIAKREQIDPKKEEIEERANQYLRQYNSAEEAQKTIDPKDLYDYTKGMLRNEKVFEMLEAVV